MQYIVFIHNNTDTTPTKESWQAFFTAARKSGLFQGGSAIANRMQLGEKKVPDITELLGGYMQFEVEELSVLKTLLESHPVLQNGGTLELCEMPKT